MQTFPLRKCMQVLHDNNDLSYKYQVVIDYLREESIEILRHSLDLSPCDFRLNKQNIADEAYQKSFDALLEGMKLCKK